MLSNSSQTFAACVYVCVYTVAVTHVNAICGIARLCGGHECAIPWDAFSIPSPPARRYVSRFDFLSAKGHFMASDCLTQYLLCPLSPSTVHQLTGSGLSETPRDLHLFDASCPMYNHIHFDQLRVKTEEMFRSLSCQ